MIPFIHHKSGRRYLLLAFAIDCTNARNGKEVAIYCPDDNEHTIYVRELDEFNAKFSPEKPVTESEGGEI